MNRQDLKIIMFYFQPFDTLFQFYFAMFKINEGIGTPRNYGYLWYLFTPCKIQGKTILEIKNILLYNSV